MSELSFYCAGATFMAMWVVASRRSDHKYDVSWMTEVAMIIMWPLSLTFLVLTILWLLLTGRLPWQR